MKILIIGSGGREHALAWKVAQSIRVTQVFVAPGNAGTAREPKIQNLAIEATDIERLVAFAQSNAVDLTIVGPEQPLVLGIVDRFRAHGLKCFGPTKGASQLEGSKAFCKDFLKRHNIPTAIYETFTDKHRALRYLDKVGVPIVIKADGLAAGKGVVVAHTLEHAVAAIEDMLGANKFGAAGARVVIEEFLQGAEASFIVMVDGAHILPLATSQDHKAIFDGDQGPNTGGMGAYSPAPIVTSEIHTLVMHDIIEPTVRGMQALGYTYTGFLYAGLMITDDGSVKVLEYNCRFGDPETQPVMMRLQSDLVELCLAAVDGRLNQVDAQWDARVALGVVMAAQGYPGEYRKQDVIAGLDIPDSTDCKVFHAGTAMRNNEVITTGGRVLCVTALADNVRAAQVKAYQRVATIHWEGAYYRKDIGHRAL